MRKFRRIKNDERDGVQVAMQFMQQRVWANAARQFRIATAGQEVDAGVEIQHGHALKEAGFLSRAEERYRQGQAGKEHDLEFHLQMGHLSKVRGRFSDAAESYRMALEFARANGDTDEVIRINRYLDPVSRLLDHGDAHLGSVDFYLSSAASKLLASVSSPASEQLGKANYSYAFAAHGFLRMFEDLGYFVQYVDHPEFFPAPRTNTAEKIKHICFAPPQLARVMKGAYNIIHFAWEFPRIPSRAENVSPHPFDDWLRMLSAFDEIWLPSQFAVSVIAPLVSKPVRWVPTPVGLPRRPVQRDRPGNAVALARTLESLRWVPLSIFPRLQSNFCSHAVARAKSTAELVRRTKTHAVPRIFLTILNPHDKRKQLKPLLDAFCEFSAGDKEAILLIKTSSPDDTNATINQRILSHQIAEDSDLIPPYVSNQVWIYNGALTPGQLTALYGVASFYVCTAYAEGQNLPLLESMAHGCVALSVNHTAMADYITETNSILIESELSEPPPSMRRTYKMFDSFEVNKVSASSVLSALRAAVELDSNDYLGLSRSAIETVRSGFGESALLARVSAQESEEQRL